MKAKIIVLVFVYVVCLLFVSVKCDEEVSKKILIDPEVKYFDSNGTIDFIHSEHAHNRSLRQADACKIPQNSEDCQINCNVYENRVSCNQTCIFGYTFIEGIQREMKCRFSENNWKPVPQFENCQPFIDCTLTLKPGGKYACYSNYLEKGPNCRVSCKSFEDKSAVPEQTYECNIDGKWEPKLPFCVKAGSGIKLVPAPRGQKQIFIGKK